MKRPVDFTKRERWHPSHHLLGECGAVMRKSAKLLEQYQFDVDGLLTWPLLCAALPKGVGAR